MTQALALRTLLDRAGHRVVGVLVGRSMQRDVPAFFLNKIGADVHYFRSPNFVTDGQSRSIRLGPTLTQAARGVGRYRASLRIIDEHVQAIQPDVIVNFYEPLLGLYNLTYRPAAPTVCIGHQYLFHHPIYPFPSGQRLERWAAQRFTEVSGFGAVRKLALSFYPAPDQPADRLTVVPPLLRDAVFAQPLDQEEPFFLAYLLNKGYGQEIERWHVQHPDVQLHCFWANPDVGETHRPRPGLTFHQLHDEKFLTMMARSQGVICTAGFESVCEAMVLGKPVLMVPVEGHFEQYCNAMDAQQVGAGLYSPVFDIQRLVDYRPRYQSPAPRVRAWIERGEARFVEAIETAATHQALAA